MDCTSGSSSYSILSAMPLGRVKRAQYASWLPVVYADPHITMPSYFQGRLASQFAMTLTLRFLLSVRDSLTSNVYRVELSLVTAD